MKIASVLKADILQYDEESRYSIILDTINPTKTALTMWGL